MKKNLLLVLVSKRLSLLIAATLFGFAVIAQETLQFRKGIFKISLTTVSSSPRALQGYLGGFTDSSISISPTAIRLNGNENSRGTLPAYNYSDILAIKVKRKGGTGRGILIGFLSGFFTGAAIGFASGDDKPSNTFLGCIFCMTAGEKALVAGAGLGTTGAVIGGIVGSLAHKTFIIQGKKEKFDELKWSLVH